MKDELEILIRNNQNILNSPAFSQRLHESIDDFFIHAPIDELLVFYKANLKILPDDGILTKGLAILTNCKKKGQSHFLLRPYIAGFIHQKLGITGIEAPPWLPLTFKLESQAKSDETLFGYDITTVSINTIDNADVNQILALAHSFIRENKPKPTREPSTVTSEQEKIQPSKDPIVEMKKSNPRVNHDAFLAKKYLSLIGSAASRGLDFDLTLSELEKVIASPKCHFSGAELVFYPHEKGEELPDNYLTIDRLDNNKGYVYGNIVCCSRFMNKIKDQMPPNEFEEIANLHNMVQSKNLGEGQRKALQELLMSSA